MKKLLFLLGGVLIMTTISGCSTKPSKQEIINKFDDFITIFPSEDLSFLYDKEGDTTDLNKGDLGTWVVSSYKYTTTEDEKRNKIGVVLRFDRNTRQAKGFLITNMREKEEDTEDNEYPVFYDKEGIHFMDGNVDESLVKELSDFKILSEILKIDEKYLQTLTLNDHYYNGEVPLFGMEYALLEEDPNLIKVKQIYPSLTFVENTTRLQFEGDGNPWSIHSGLSLDLFLDEEYNNYFSFRLHFSKSDSFKQQQDEE